MGGRGGGGGGSEKNLGVWGGGANAEIFFIN